jgi:hypothetical protein
MENSSHTKKIHELARFKMEQWLAQNKQHLEERRDRLYTLLEDEDNCFKKEMTADFESRRENQLVEMRKRVEALRAKREEHQKKIVDQKLDQCFGAQCEEMRSLLSKRMTKEIAQDWGTQIEMKNRLECEQQAEERMWAYVSELDVQEKEKRETAERQIRMEAYKRGLVDLEQQIKLKNMKKAEAYKIRLRELAMLQEDLRALEEERENRVKAKEERFIRAKAHAKDMIETRDYYRDRKLKKEEIAAREFLKKAVRELYLEQEDRNKKKRELMRAMKLYNDYSRRMDCLKNEKEGVVQRIVDEVIEEQHKISMEFRYREARQRHELHCDVMAGRALQVEDKRRALEAEEEEKQRELETLKKDWKLYLDELEQERLNKEAKKVQYVCDLNGQVRYLTQLKEREYCETQREEKMCELEERLFNNRLRTTIQSAKLPMSNPTRECLRGKPIRQCFRQV